MNLKRLRFDLCATGRAGGMVASIGKWLPCGPPGRTKVSSRAFPGNEKTRRSGRVRWQSRKDSNLNKQSQNLLCYRYTTRLLDLGSREKRAASLGLEPRNTESKSGVLPLHYEAICLAGGAGKLTTRYGVGNREMVGKSRKFVRALHLSK